MPTCSATVLTNCISTTGNASNLVNTEPRGSEELPALSTLDLRAGRVFRLGGQRFDLSVDCYNVTNANTVWQVRTNTVAPIGVRVGREPRQPAGHHPEFRVADRRVCRRGCSAST